MSHHPSIRLKPKQGRRVRGGAPWVFSNEIEMSQAAKALPPGSLVTLEDEANRVLGTGYFNPNSLIAVRMLAWTDKKEIGADFLGDRLAGALARRQALFAEPYYRLVHAEGDGLPGLVADRYGDTLALQITTAGMEALTAPLLEALDHVLAPRHVILRNDAPIRAQEGLAREVKFAKGEVDRITVEENGVHYLADLQGGQKTGWYYDQRDNRAFMAALSRGRSVLDAYCHSGGFALLAAKQGAAEVTGIDSSQAALTLASDAAVANGVAKTSTFVKADVLEELARLAAAKQKFDVVICDPPPFVRAKKDLEAGARAYRKLARLAASITGRGGFLLLASCSHNISAERFSQECALGLVRAGRHGGIIRQSGAGPDHPVHPMLPETAYLKALVYALD